MGQSELLTTRMWSHKTLGIYIRECGHIEHHGWIPTFCKLQNISLGVVISDEKKPTFDARLMRSNKKERKRRGFKSKRSRGH